MPNGEYWVYDIRNRTRCRIEKFSDARSVLYVNGISYDFSTVAQAATALTGGNYYRVFPVAGLPEDFCLSHAVRT